MPEWMEQAGLPEDLAGDPSLANIPDVSTLAKAFVDTKKMAGGMVKIPGPETTDEELDTFYSKLRPESADKYEIQREGFPEGLEYDEKMEKLFLDEVAFPNGLSKRQAQSAIEWWNKMAVAMNDEMSNAKQEAQEALKQEWGQGYDANMGLAKQVAQKLGGQEYADGLGDMDNITLKILSQIGKMTGDDSVVKGQVSKTSAQEQLDKIRKDANHPFNNRMHPEHRKAREQVLALFVQGAK